MSAKRNLIEKI